MAEYNVEHEIEKTKSLNKSFLFLYPILQLRCKKPIQTYLGFEGFEENKTLICLLHKDDPEFDKTINYMTNHGKYDFYIEDGDYVYVSFYLGSITALYDQIKNGEYSKISGSARTLLIFENVGLINFGLNPSIYYSLFAEFYEYNEETMRNNHWELVSKPNPDSEYVTLSKSVKEKLNEILVI